MTEPANEQYFHVELFSRLTKSTFLLVWAKDKAHARAIAYRYNRRHGNLWLYVKDVLTTEEYFSKFPPRTRPPAKAVFCQFLKENVTARDCRTCKERALIRSCKQAPPT